MAFISDIHNEKGEVLARLVTTHDCYELPGGLQMYIRTQVVWCLKCKKFTLAEELQNADEIERHVKEYCDEMPLLPSLGIDDMEDLFKRARDSMREEGIAEARAWGEAMKTRRSPPRCLECGRFAFVPVRSTGEYIKHPTKSERIRVTCTTHASMARWRRLFTTEGINTRREARK